MSRSARYALAVALVGVATMLRMMLSHLVGSQFPFATYYVAVFFAMWFCGTAPSIMATLLGYIGAEYFFIGRPALDADPIAVFLYFVVSVTIICFGRSLRRAKLRVEAAMAEVRRRQHECELETETRKRAELDLQAAREDLRRYAEMVEKQVAERTQPA